MMTVDPQSIATSELHQILVSTVAPRPIALVSTVNEEGLPNLAPYSFFNVFSSNPPTLIFSSNRKIKDDSLKDTLHNVEATGEVVINAVTRSIARQVALASIEYPRGVSEFAKAGLTPLKSEVVKPFRVAESPAQFECRVKNILPLGEKGGAGNLVICEVVKIHLREDIFDKNGKIDPQRLDLVGRMGRTYYCHAARECIFSIYQPVHVLGIGFDQLPREIRESNVFTGEDLAHFASQTKIPSFEDVKEIWDLKEVKELLNNGMADLKNWQELAKEFLKKKKPEEAFAIAMAGIYYLKENKER